MSGSSSSRGYATDLAIASGADVSRSTDAGWRIPVTCSDKKDRVQGDSPPVVTCESSNCGRTSEQRFAPNHPLESVEERRLSL